MKATEIKKLYSKAKKAYEKRTGDKFTWVMNARQQRLGTATVMTDYLMDYEEQLRRCEQYMAEFDTVHWPARKAEHLRHASEEKRRNDGWTFWQEHTTPEALEKSREEMLQQYIRYRDEKRERLQKHGSYSEQYERAVKYAEEMIQAPEIQSFLKAIGGQAVLDIKEHGAGEYSYAYTEVYVRFLYQATEE